jgi:hypothetical protein
MNNRRRRKSAGNRPSRKKRVVIAGVEVSSEFLHVLRVKKRRVRATWLLETLKGKLIAKFSSEMRLTLWWSEFEAWQSREAAAAKEKTSKGVKRKADVRTRQSCQSPALRDPSDPLRPWSDKYDMPEYDLE